MKIGGGLPAGIRVLGHALTHHPVERGGHRRLQRGQRRRFFLEDGGDEAGLAARLECGFAGDGFVQHQAEGEDVAARIGGLALQLRRRHVLERAEDAVLFREWLAMVALASLTVDRAATLARPKSSSLMPALVTRMLPGFRSRWTTPLTCAAWSASAA